MEIDHEKYQERTEDIKAYMLGLHLSIKEGKTPSDREIKILGKKFFERDRDISKEHDLEMSHVIRGFEWGMIAMRQIVKGNNLEKDETNKI